MKLGGVSNIEIMDSTTDKGEGVHERHENDC
jgi:hypothetical protein